MQTETLPRRSHTATYEPLPQAARAARHLVAGLLPRWGMAGLVGDAGLIVTELVANAIRSGRAIRLEVCAEGGVPANRGLRHQPGAAGAVRSRPV